MREMFRDRFKDQLARRLERPENAPLNWGPVKGWVSDSSAHLYVDCPNEELGAGQRVHVEVSFGNLAERHVDDVRAVLGQLVADGARYVAKGLKCKGADKLPTGPATFG
ncbi:hypothetical protein ACWGQ4_14070 [Streptomyces sp. NPDC055721]|uniref:hypothetical protein n=1 Tax=Streptomyces sp. NPDC127132 TaxID=3345374 RepID=UPI00362779F6